MQKLTKRLLTLGLIVSVTFSSIFPGVPVRAEAASTGIDANSKIEAESYNTSNSNLIQSGDITGSLKTTEGDTKEIHNTLNGSDVAYAIYDNINFDLHGSNYNVFTMRYSIPDDINSGGSLEVWIDDLNNTWYKIGSTPIAQTNPSDGDMYKTVSCDLTQTVTGNHNLKLVFIPDSGKTSTCNLNWFYFSKKLTSADSISVDNTTKKLYLKGETFKAYQDVILNTTYSDGSKSFEYVGANDVTGFDSSAVTSNQVLTVNVRGLNVTYPIQVKDKFTGTIQSLAPITGIENGKPLGLPNTLKVSNTTSVDEDATVTWDVPGANYDPTVKAKQEFTVTGTITLPDDLVNTDNHPLTTTVNVTVNAATGFKFSFMSISDIHITDSRTSGYNADIETRIENNFKSALLDAKKNRCSALTVVGDMVENSDNSSIQEEKVKSEYQTFKNILTQNTSIPSYYVLGNHDAKYENFGKVVELFNQYTGSQITATQPYYDQWIGDNGIANNMKQGYHFIFLNTDSENKDLAYISDQQIAWLDSKLAENASQGKPIFVFLHQPIGSTLPDSYLNEVSRSDPAQDEKMMQVLSKYPQTIMINGHIHNDITKLATVYNVKVCTMVRDGSAGKGYNNDGTKPQGLIFEVYDDRVDINGREFITNTNIFNYSVKNITTENVNKDGSGPSAPQNLTVTHKTDSMVSLSWGDSTDNFSSEHNNVGVAGYYLYVNGNPINNTPIVSNNYVVTGLAPNTSYTFTLIAKDLKGNASTGSNVAATTLFTNDAPTNLALNKPATASNSATGPSAAVDGNGATSWVSTAANISEWFRVDLGAVYDLSRWIVKNASSAGGNPADNAKTYTLNGSIDGSNWFVLDAVLSNVSAITDQFFNRTLARFVKLLYTSPSNYNEKQASIANLYEFEVYGGNIYKGIETPTTISNLPYGTAKTAADLHLPSKVTIVASSGKVSATVNWDVNGCNYNQAAASAQNFYVYGNVVLPAGVINPDGIPLIASVNVSVEDRLTRLVLSPGSTKLKKGKTIQTSVKGYLANGSVANLSKGTFVYASSNTKVATVSSKGLITAKGAGTATISAGVILNGIKYPSNTIKITVPSSDATLKSITFNGRSIAGFSGGTTTYYVMLPKTKKVPKVKASVKSSKAKASIKATKKMPGTTTIKVTAEDGSTKTYNVKFSFDRISSVKLKAGSTKIKKGKTTQLSKQAYKGSTKADISNGKVQYSVSNKKILSIDSKGKIKAKAKGTAKVKIKVVLNKVTYTSNTITIKVG